jgi:NosR/NirI family nitrous oxide reductase transcriptional regulator
VPGAVLAAWVLAGLAPSFDAPQDAPEAWLELLRRVVPRAERFTDRRGQPPVFEAYARDPSTGAEALVGYAFLTSDLPPEQKGFNAPIEVLVGMDLGGVLTGIVVTDYTESHRATRGDFLAAPGFQEQFAGKDIGDAFQVRRDVDGITGATITVDAMSRGIRNAAREVALAYGAGLSVDDFRARMDPVSITLEELERLSWPQMLLGGLAQQISVLDGERVAADVTLLYVRDELVARMMIGSDLWGQVLERAGPQVSERHVVVAGVDGPSAGSLNLERLSIVSPGEGVGLSPSEVLLFGPPREGKLDGQVRMTRVLLFERTVDMTMPFAFVLDLRPASGVFTAQYPGRVRGAGPLGGAGLLAVLVGLLVVLATALLKRRAP